MMIALAISPCAVAAPDVEAFGLEITGRSTDALGLYAQVGNHASIGYTEDPVSGTETVKWSNSSNPADAATYGTGASPTDFAAGDGGTLWLHVTDGGDTVSRSAAIRYAPGSVTESSLSNWTIDDDPLNINFASDFTTTNLTGSYVITGLPSGAVDDGDGTISGTPDGTPESTTITVTFTDQYSRTIVGSYPITTEYRAQATGGADLDLAYPEDSAITPQDLLANWTTNGNTLTFVSVSPALPAGLSINSSGTLSGTPTTVTADATYTLTMQDEYGRQTSDTFTLEITAVQQLSAVDLQAQETGTGDVPVALTGDNGTYSWVLVTTDPAVNAPSRTQVNAGQDHTGSEAPASGTVAITSGTPENVALPSGLSGSYYLVVADGDSVLYDATAQAIDTTAATFSADSFSTGTGAGEVDWAFTPNEDSAAVTGYRVSLWADGSTPSDAEIESGAGSVVSTTGTATASVAETGTLTGSAGVVYVPTIFYVDVYGNKTFETYADVAAGASGYSQVFEDTFTRGSDEALTASADWTEIYNATTITANVFSATGLLTVNSSSASVNFDTAAWVCETALNNDQWAEFEYTSVAGVNRAMGLLVRASAAASFVDAYMLRYQDDGAGQTCKIFKMVNSEFGTELATVNQTLSAGDRIRFRASGSSTVTLEAEINTGSGWTSLLSSSDSSSPLASGKSGLWATVRSQGSTMSITRFALGNWS